MQENNYVFTKKMKILAIISIPITVLTMIFFLVSIYRFKETKAEAVIYVSMVLFLLAVMFEFFVIIYCLKEWYKVYKEKYKDF